MSRTKRTQISYEPAPDIQAEVSAIVRILNLGHIDLERVVCVRSRGTSARRIIARCHGLSKVLQLAMGVNLEGEPASRFPLPTLATKMPRLAASLSRAGHEPRAATKGSYPLGSPDDRLPAASRGACPPLVKAFYALEFISERFDKLDDRGREETIIHELMHIPRNFGGGFRHHDLVTDRNVRTLWERYRGLKSGGR